MDLGIVGNCQYSALIDNHGSVKWLCWPRLDSAFVFGGLVDEDCGGDFRICPPESYSSGQEYIENTNILTTTFKTAAGSFQVIDFAPRFHQFDRYYKPTMLIRIVRPLSGKPQGQVSFKPTMNYGEQLCETFFGSNHIAARGHAKDMRLTTNAPLTYVDQSIPFLIDRTFYFVLTYGAPLEQNLRYTCEDFLEKTKAYWHTWVRHCHLPQEYQKQVIRSALVLKLHQFEDTGAIIAATTTSIPEAKGTERNWDYRFCWLRDAMFSLSALQRLTHFEELEHFINYLKNLVEKSKSRDYFLQPVFGIDGSEKLTEHILDHLDGYKGNKPVRIGNQAYEHLQHDVYGEMMVAIAPLFYDQRFSAQREALPNDLMQQMLRQIEKYLSAKDAGLWEFRGIAQLHTFSLLMHWAGAKTAYHIFNQRDPYGLKKKAQELYSEAARIIESQCWSEELGTYTQAANQKELDASLLMMINMGYLEPNDPKAKSMIAAIQQQLGHETGLLHRYKAPDDFGETENAFLICSFWLVEALAITGQKAEARELFGKLLNSSNPLGLFSEDLDPTTMELWGNFPQTYSHVGLINAAFALSEDRGCLYLK